MFKCRKQSAGKLAVGKIAESSRSVMEIAIEEKSRRKTGPENQLNWDALIREFINIYCSLVGRHASGDYNTMFRFEFENISYKVNIFKNIIYRN